MKLVAALEPLADICVAQTTMPPRTEANLQLDATLLWMAGERNYAESLVFVPALTFLNTSGSQANYFFGETSPVDRAIFNPRVS